VGKIRHIAYRSEDVEAMANFFVQGLEMEIVQRRSNGAVDLTDGTLNITILPMRIARGDGKVPRPGIEHIGFTVADEAATRQRLEALGATQMNRIDMGPVNYEVKYTGIENIEIDLGHWAGAAPIDPKQSAPAHA